MPIYEKDRRDYERGLRDRSRPAVEQVVTDLTRNHPDTSAYHRGRRGEHLDGSRKYRRPS